MRKDSSTRFQPSLRKWHSIFQNTFIGATNNVIFAESSMPLYDQEVVRKSRSHLLRVQSEETEGKRSEDLGDHCRERRRGHRGAQVRFPVLYIFDIRVDS